MMEDLLQRFETAWKVGTMPDLAAFLPDPGSAERRRILEELIKSDLEHRWRQAGQAGQDGRSERRFLEDYQQLFPELGPLDNMPLELIEAEYWVRKCWGDQPPHSVYESRFAMHATPLKEALVRLDHEWACEAACEERKRRAESEEKEDGGGIKAKSEKEHKSVVSYRHCRAYSCFL